MSLPKCGIHPFRKRQLEQQKLMTASRSYQVPVLRYMCAKKLKKLRPEHVKNYAHTAINKRRRKYRYRYMKKHKAKKIVDSRYVQGQYWLLLLQTRLVQGQHWLLYNRHAQGAALAAVDQTCPGAALAAVDQTCPGSSTGCCRPDMSRRQHRLLQIRHVQGAAHAAVDQTCPGGSTGCCRPDGTAIKRSITQRLRHKT